MLVAALFLSSVMLPASDGKHCSTQQCSYTCISYHASKLHTNCAALKGALFSHSCIRPAQLQCYIYVSCRMQNSIYDAVQVSTLQQSM